MQKTPCKDCTKRVLGCQEKCETLKAYLEDYHARKAYCGPKAVDLYIAQAKRRPKKK